MSENKPKISISLEAGLLRRIDDVCTARNEARSALIERVLEREIDSEEEFMRDMENPLWRGLLSALAKSPGVTQAIAKVVGENLTDEQLSRIRERLPQLVQSGKEREARKKRARSQGKLEVEGA